VCLRRGHVLLLLEVVAKRHIRPHVVVLDAAQRLAAAERLQHSAVGQLDAALVPHGPAQVAEQLDQQLVGGQLMLDGAQPVIGALGV